ncbi:MAG: hypothetical protein QOJ15_10223, partial [Bradyrhizobium sp.]|nr:hypothetical protein [Bradyrhizobium sp.]
MGRRDGGSEVDGQTLTVIARQWVARMRAR